jgi:hypothetical protein
MCRGRVKPVVSILCQGGLGNQLFTLNAAQLLSSEFQCQVVIIFNGSQIPSNRPVEIQNLVDGFFANLKIDSSPLLFKAGDICDRIGVKVGLYPQDTLFKGFVLDSRKIDLGLMIHERKPRIVRGFFQNSAQVLEIFPTYFEKIQDYLETIELEPILPKEYQAFHIRRGDYVFNRETLGELLPRYYQDSRVDNLPLVITTDDSKFMGEIRSNFPQSLVFGPDDTNVWQSFKILSKAQSLTIANSTFSWWAGLMAHTLGASVVRPNRWNKVETLDSNYLHHPGFIEMESHFA